MKAPSPIGLNAWMADMLQASWEKIRYRLPISTGGFLDCDNSKIAY